MVYNPTRAEIYTKFGYPNTANNSEYQWVSTTPDQDLQDAMEGLPETSNNVYSIDPLTHPALLALQAVVTTEQWSDFLIWQKEKLNTTCCVFFWVTGRAGGNFCPGCSLGAP